VILIENLAFERGTNFESETMKLTNLTIVALLAAVTSLAGPATKLSQEQVTAIEQAFVGIRAPELAARAADVVAKAPEGERNAVAVATVRVVVSKRPASAPAVVSAVAKIAPQASAELAAEAARIAPGQSAEIAKAAAASAPLHAEQIAVAVAKVAPRQQTVRVTRSVVSVVPEASVQVVESVSAAVPAAAAQIEKDPTITRIRTVAASHGGFHGIVGSNPGTIAGDTRPAPTPVLAVQEGYDPNRYGTP
jgi:hypothetical protein